MFIPALHDDGVMRNELGLDLREAGLLFLAYPLRLSRRYSGA